MTQLYDLFPGLAELDGEIVPDWSSFDYPWEILREGETGLSEQIRKINRNESVFIHETARINGNAFIEGPSYIGANVEVRHGAYIRKGSWICDGAIVGHSSEIKNSILLPGSKAPHFNYVGDSILGFHSNIGAGVKLSNVRNDRRNVMLQLGDNSLIDSGTYKLGALVGDCSQIGCNVVTNPGTILVPKSMIGPNETISGWFDSRSG